MGLAEKIKEPFTFFFKYIFHLLMYVPFHAIRITLIRMVIIKQMGKKNFFCMGTRFRGKSSNFIFGDNVFVNQGVLLDGRGGKLIVGNNVDIGQEVNIWTLEHDPHDDYHITKGGDIIIEDYVWISTRATILPGVKIGRGAVVALGSIVTKDVPAMAIVGGIPAKVIGQRKSKLLYKLDKFRPWFT